MFWRKKHDALEYLDLRQEPVIRSSAPCHSKMHSQSACDCYCKIREPTQCHRNEIQSDRSRAKLVTSKTSVSKTDATRGARKIPFTPASPINDDQTDTKRSTAILPVSPVLSPETSAALEDVDRLVKDAQIQIKAINMVADCSGLQRLVNGRSNEICLDDENDQLLYVRERVASKFQEANGWIDANYRGPKNEEISYEKRVPAKPKRVTDFSAPKFKTFEERYKEFPWCGPFGIQDLGISTVDTENKGTVDDPSGIPNNERTTKRNTFSVQTCPPVNIERQLTAQNLENIHISPDPSFIQENCNVGTYIVSHECGTKSQARKEKFVKIFEEPKDATSNKRSSETQKKKNRKATNEIESSPESSQSSVSKGTSSGILVHSHSEEKQNEKKTAEINGEDKEKHKSVAPEVAVCLVQRKSEDREVQVEIETFERRTDEKATGASSELTSNPKGDQKQVRFNVEDQENVEKSPSGGSIGKERGPILKRDAKISKSVELEDESILNDNLDRLEDALTSREIEMREDLLSLHDKKKQKVRDEEKREHEHDKIIHQRFASLHCKYSNQNEQSVENSSLLGSSSIDTSGEGSGHEDDDEDELYYPSIDALDNVLLAYNKTIDDASRSIRTIDKYLSRPELEEFLQNDEISDSNESPKFTEQNRKKIEMPKRNCNSVQSKRNTDSNSVTRSKNTGSVQLNSTRCKKLDNNTKNKCASQKNPYRTPLRVDTRVTRPSSADSIVLSKGETELTESEKIAKHVEETYASFFKVSRPRKAIVFRARDESSSFASSANSSFSSTDLTQRYDNKIEALSRVVDNSVAKQVSSPRSNAAFVEDIGEKQTETIVGFEDRLKNAFNVEEMMPLLVKNLLQHLQKGVAGSPQNLELLITENASVNNVESNIGEIETARLKTDNESEKECSGTGFQTGATEIVKSDEKITEKNANDKSICENVNTGFIDKPIGQSSNSKQTATCLKQEISSAEPSKINSEVESLGELLSTRSSSTSNRNVKDNDVKRCEYLEQKGNNNGSLASSRIVDKRTENDEKKTDEKNQNNVSICLNEDAVSEATNNESTESKGTGSTQPSDSLNDHSPSKLNPRVENEKIESSSDSLRDCVSLQSNSRQEPKVLNMMESTRSIKDSDQFTEINNAPNNISNSVSNEKRSSSHLFQKEKILSDLYDEIREQIRETTNYSTLVQQDMRTSENMLATDSTKIETVSSDTSRSEGELLVPSSGSCSLGEIKMLNTDEQDNIITVFVTKETLTLWSESSKSLVQSMGEI